MNKLSTPLKALIAAPYARPDTIKAPKHIRSLFKRLRNDAVSKSVAPLAWLTLSTATSMTMNSPESMTELFHLASSNAKGEEQIQTAELMREIGLKCMGFNGIPRTINCLEAFRGSLPPEIVSQLSTTPSRLPTRQNISDIQSRGENLWQSIYRPFSKKLLDKLALSHPDLPIWIISSAYGALFSNPESPTPSTSASRTHVGRVLTSVTAISCLRAQTGVGPQVTSHVFGLRKAFEDGSYKKEGEDAMEGGEWLASDDGSMWLLGSVDSIVEAIGEGRGTSFAPGLAKL